MNEEMARRELIKVGERTQLPGGQNNTVETRWGQKVNGYWNATHSWGNTTIVVLLQHQSLASSASWSADKLSRAKAEWTDLLDNSIRIELAAMLRGHQPYSSGPLSQISG